MASALKKSKPLDWEDQLRIAEALTVDVLQGSRGWSALAELSPNTVIDDVDVLLDTIKVDGNGIRGLFNVSVTLNYADDQGAFASLDEFPGNFTAHYDLEGKIIFDDVTVETRSFYL